MTFVRFVGECGVLFFLTGLIFGILGSAVLGTLTISVQRFGGGMAGAQFMRAVGLIVKSSSYWMLCTLIALAARSHAGGAGIAYWAMIVLGALLFLFINCEGVSKAEQQARKAQDDSLATQPFSYLISDVVRKNSARFWLVEYTVVAVATLYLILMAWFPSLANIPWLIAIWNWAKSLFSAGSWISVPFYILGWIVCLKGLLAICLGIGALPFLALQKKAAPARSSTPEK